MKLLRVLIDRAATDGDLASPWALIEAGSGRPRTGTGPPDTWPRADRVEALLVPDLVRVATLRLPPVPPGRLREAARFALEDQLLDSPDSLEFAVSAQRSDGSVRAAIADSRRLAGIREALARSGARSLAIVPATDLALPSDGRWAWLSLDDSGAPFIVMADGSVAGVDAVPAGAGETEADPPPPSLVLALEQATREARRPAALVPTGPRSTAERDRLARWLTSTGIAIDPPQPWAWDAALPAPELAVDFATTAPPSPPAPGSGRKLFVTAAVIAAVAVAAHTVFALADRLWTQWRVDAVVDAQRRLAGTVAPELLGSQTPASALARKHREARHRAGLPAADDLLPLLGTAAQAVRTLPAGTLRVLSFAPGQITAEFAALPEDTLVRLQRDLEAAGLTSVAAPTASGVRMRITLE
jgi:type II secretion system protein L